MKKFFLYDPNLLVYGFAMVFFASFGQTFYIALFNDDIRNLYKTGFANQPDSVDRGDGLELQNMYLTTALKCVPPEDKPTSQELKTCFNFFNQEIAFLKKIKVIVALGKIGHDACVNYYKQQYEIRNKDFIFSHGSMNILPDKKILVGSYHPSPRNVNTGRIDESKMVKLLNSIKKLL